MRVLLVEDDEALGVAILDRLQSNAVDARLARSLGEARLSLAEHIFDVLVLDVMLPDGDGRSLARTLRGQGKSVPILMLTALDAVEETVNGLDAGADDYLTKPFAVSELLARLRALARRSDVYVAHEVKYADLVLEQASFSLTCGSNHCRLTRNEFDLLWRMLRSPEKIFSKPFLGELIYSGGDGWSDNALETVIHRLRKKIKTIGSRCEIRSLRGLGYMLRLAG